MARTPAPLARLTVDLAAVVANYRRLVALAGGPCGAAVKADAYGLGMIPVARALAVAGCRAFFVAHLAEALSLRSALPGVAIHPLGPFSEEDLPLLLAADLAPVINTAPQALSWRAGAAARPAALMVDTGMNRLGLPAGQLGEIMASGLAVDLLMSHLACADTPDHPQNDVQLRRFHAVATQFPAARLSLANSAGIGLGAGYGFDLARPGIALYGGDAGPPAVAGMAGVVHAEARVVQLKTIAAGDGVGYGASWVADRPTRIATLAAGYADGYPRALSNNGWVGLGGARCPVVGRVSMDLICVDASAAADVAVGDWACLIGGSGPDINELSRLSDIVHYEILTGLGERFARYYRSAE